MTLHVDKVVRRRIVRLFTAYSEFLVQVILIHGERAVGIFLREIFLPRGVEQSVENEGEKQSWNHIVEVRNAEQEQDDDEDEDLGFQPGVPIDVLEAGVADVADHQVGN